MNTYIDILLDWAHTLPSAAASLDIFAHLSSLFARSCVGQSVSWVGIR